MFHNKTERGQSALLFIPFLVLIAIGAYFALMSYYQNVSAPEFTFGGNSVSATLHDFEKNPSILAAGTTVSYGDTKWYCEDGNMYFTQRANPTKDFFSPGCPGNIDEFKKALDEIKKLINDAVNSGKVPAGVDWRILIQSIEQILHWL